MLKRTCFKIEQERSGMKIAILGGSFDPPHKGHVTIANRLLKLFGFDEIWLIPCYQHPFNKPSTSSVLGKNLSSVDKRFAMVKYLEKDKVKVSDFEINKKTTSYTIDTLEFLSKTRPSDKFCWAIGTDQIGSFNKWKRWKEIVDNFKIIIVPRTGFKKARRQLEIIAKQVANPENIVLVDRKKFPPIYISSTSIRKQIKENKSISNQVPKNVEKYIMKQKLYQ